jgi:HK97 family phage prohead protease
MRTKIGDLQHLKAGPDDGLGEREFKAYASTWTRTPDSYGDVVAKGAFADTIKRWRASGNVLPILYGHDMADPHKNIAATKLLIEDEHGLLVHGVFDDTEMATKVYELVKGRRLSQLSFAYDVVQQAPVTLDGGIKANELRKVRLYEVSLVMVGANQDTEVLAVKSPRSTRRDLELRMRLARAG